MSLFQGEFPPLRGFQLLAHESLRDGARAGHKKQLVMAPTGSGKCLGPLTPVIMSDGSIKRACRVKAGDRLMGPDGKGRNVVGVNRGTGPLYRVIPTKGDAFTCNDVHLLSLVRTPGSDGINLPSGRHIGREESGPFFVEAQDLARANDTAKHCLKAWRPEAVDFESECTVHPIPPYILGLWLGDGTSRSSIITKPDGPVVQAWRDYAASIGCEVTQIKANGKCDGWRIKKSTHGHEHNHLHAALIGLGILGNKRIPQSYIMTTRQDRLELLAGLLDTDGSLLCGGYDFIQKEKQIADAVVFLCRSLGLAAYVSNQLKGIASTGFEAFYWRVSISGDCSIIPCRDPKKRAPARMQKKNHLVTGLRIKSVGIGPYVGFEIDGDRQFLLGDWQVTHNTILALNYIQQALKKGKRAMFVCDRKTLIAQTSNVAREVGLGYHGIIQANNPMMDLSRPFQIASAQTLMRRGWPQNMDVIVVDEVHSQYKTWVDYVTSDECKAHVLGLSATPFSTGLGRIFTNLINAATMHDLVNLGILVPMRIFSCRKPNMEGAETSGGEWTDKAAEERELVIVGDVVREWTRFAENRKTIVFGATILHCEEMARQFNEAGIPAATFCADTPDDERARILREFEYGNIRILISVEALAKGFDCKDLSCVCDCRPLRKSLSTFIQMVGRGARSSPETGKKDFLLLDFSGNIIRFADDFSRIYFNGLDRLDDGEKLDKEIRKDEEKPIKACPKCGYKPMGKRCVGCGYEPEPKALIEQLPGEMTEIKLKNGKVLAADKVELFCQLSTYVKSSSIADPEKREKRVMALYKAIANEWPPREMKAATAPEVQPNRATVNKIKSIYTAWAHRKAS